MSEFLLSFSLSVKLRNFRDNEVTSSADFVVADKDFNLFHYITTRHIEEKNDLLR